MSKRRSDGLGDDRKADRRRQRRRVYFVIDDGAGYAIRKIDLSSDYDSDDDAECFVDETIETTGAVLPLPRPLIRLAALTGEFFTASGTKILATRCRDWPKRVAPAFDVRSRSLTPGPRPSKHSATPLYMPVGRGLVSLNASFAEFLDPPPPPEHSGFVWSWGEVDQAPFTRLDVTCHAAHPDGRTLFVSTVRKGSKSTFSLDTTDDGFGVWRRHGEWTLPFHGNAHFDSALDAWVGLCDDKKYLGYLCSCDVVPILAVVAPAAAIASGNMQPIASADSDVASIGADPGSKVQPTASDGETGDGRDLLPPRWRLGKEKMFSEDPDEEHLGAVLVYMGGRSKYCLLECFSVLDEDAMDNDDEDDPYKEEVRQEDLPRHHLLRLTTFTLKYDKNGELSTAKRRRVRCYKLLPHADPLGDDIRAFLI